MNKRRKSVYLNVYRVRLFATPWTVAYQAPPSMGFSRQECWSGLPFPSPGDLPNPGLPHCRQTLYRLSHQGSPGVLKCVSLNPKVPWSSGCGAMLVAQSCPTLCDPMDCNSPGSSAHGDSPGNNTGVGCHFLLQGIFPIQGSNSALPHRGRIL